MTRQATEVERKLQNSDIDGEKKGWDRNKYATQSTIMRALLIIARVVPMMALMSDTVFKETEKMRLRQLSILSGARILSPHTVSYSQRGALICNLSKWPRPEVRWQSLK